MILETAPAAAALAPANSRLECPTGLQQPRKDLLEQSRKLQELVQRAEGLHDPVARALVHECLQGLLALYGNGLGRVLEIVRGGGPGTQPVLERITNDPVISGLLLVHGLHPVPLLTRLEQAIDKVRPYLQSHGGNVELLGLENEVARLRLVGTCHSCPSSSITLEFALRRAIEEACPDLLGFEVEGVPTTSSAGNHVCA